ncbi:MAG: hypothetical protein ACI9PP_000934 [Halobacteriales archaeon]|jgi:hypothetical protein
MADETVPDNRLFEWYRTFIGEPDAKTDVYLGFGLFFGGIVLALGALAIYIYALSAGAPDTPAFYRPAEWAYGMGMLAIPVATTGIVVLLPIDQRAIYATAGGDVLILLSVYLFREAYWANWQGYGAGDTVLVLALYTIGLTLVVGSTGAALVAAQIERARAPSPSEIEPIEAEDSEESYTEDEIRHDIDEAMSEVEITWGGVEKHQGRTLSFTQDSDIDSTGLDVEPEKTRSSRSNVEDAVDGLQGLKGGQKNTATSTSTVDDQTQKLKELKAQKREKDEAAESQSGGFIGRVLGRL